MPVGLGAVQEQPRSSSGGAKSSPGAVQEEPGAARPGAAQEQLRSSPGGARSNQEVSVGVSVGVPVGSGAAQEQPPVSSRSCK